MTGVEADFCSTEAAAKLTSVLSASSIVEAEVSVVAAKLSAKEFFKCSAMLLESSSSSSVVMMGLERRLMSGRLGETPPLLMVGVFSVEESMMGVVLLSGDGDMTLRLILYAMR